MVVLEPPNDGNQKHVVKVKAHENAIFVFDSPYVKEKVLNDNGLTLNKFEYRFMVFSYVE